jgi:alpha-ketoglutarate-dependent taurine dioxygenase
VAIADDRARHRLDSGLRLPRHEENQMSTMTGTRDTDWLAAQRDTIRRQVTEDGRVLVRGLPIHDRQTAISAVRELLDEPLTETEGFAGRASYGDGVHASTEWPPDQPLCMHNELSYRSQAPQRLVFACVTPPTSGGITALADTRAVLADLPADVVARFESTGWRLTRNYTGLVGIRWQDAFGTTDPTAATTYCAEHDIEATWDADGNLHTTQTRPAIVKHPVTADRCWFNQIAFLNEHTMVPEYRDYLISQLGPEGLPFTTSFGDGEPLDRETVDLINAVYEKHTTREPWQTGDLLVIDNILTAHSREPYQGPREVLVGMDAPTHVS